MTQNTDTRPGSRHDQLDEALLPGTVCRGRVGTRVCLLWEGGPLALRFSTPRGTYLKKGLEPFPL